MCHLLAEGRFYIRYAPVKYRLQDTFFGLLCALTMTEKVWVPVIIYPFSLNRDCWTYIFTDPALGAGLVIELPCFSVCLCVCMCVTKVVIVNYGQMVRVFSSSS